MWPGDGIVNNDENCVSFYKCTFYMHLARVLARDKDQNGSRKNDSSCHGTFFRSHASGVLESIILEHASNNQYYASAQHQVR